MVRSTNPGGRGKKRKSLKRVVRGPEEKAARKGFERFLKEPTRENEKVAKETYKKFYAENSTKALQLKMKAEEVLRKSCMKRMDEFLSSPSKESAEHLERSVVTFSSLNETDARVLMKHLEKICFNRVIDFNKLISIRW